VSTSEGDSGAAGFEALESAVDRLLDRVREMEETVRKSNRRRQEVETLLERMTTGDENPARMSERIQALESENQDLRRRLGEGRSGVDRLLARVRYLEENG
jgi:predicted RNase H-like nuclease (RuvC/YqgF family)